MASFKEIITDTKPKTVEKLEKALQNGNSTRYFEAAKSEALMASVYDEERIKTVVTDNYVIFYGKFYIFGNSKEIRILPISEIVNIYRTNVVNNEYNYDSFHLAVVMADGRLIFPLTVMRDVKGSFNYFDNLITKIKSSPSWNNNGQI